MKNKKLWLAVIIAVMLIGSGLTFGSELLGVLQSQAAGITDNAAKAENNPLAGETTPIRSATGSNQVSAAGNIAVVSDQSAVFQVEGTVTEVMVEVGDRVQAGDVLATLDTADLERAVLQAELNLAANQAQLDKLLEPADPAELVSAQANLTSAQENLLDVQAGPGPTELAAAEANLAAAQQRYQDLLDGPSQAELTQLSADLERLSIDLQQAQWDYDAIAYSDSIGASPQAAALQQATISYEAAQAAYQIAIEPAAAAEVQEALSAIQSATDQLETLRAQPTAAELAAAEAQVASAAAQLEALLVGAGEADLRAAEINVEKAQLDLDKARDDLAQATLTAPSDGTILAVGVSVGQNVSSGFSAITLSDLNALELTINVAEVDIRKVQTNQLTEITIDALPDQVIQGQVTEIAPSSEPEQGVVNYPVTVQLTGGQLTQVRPGMTAVATILDEDSAAAWLVPTTALQEQAGQTTVIVLRSGQPTPIEVQTQGSQGEWTVVQSTELQAGDEAVGSVSTFLSEDEPARLGGPGQGLSR